MSKANTIAAPLHTPGPDEAQATANARLIAAAPDLLAALDEAYGELLADSHRDGPRCLLLTTIEEALAKTRGAA